MTPDSASPIAESLLPPTAVSPVPERVLNWRSTIPPAVVIALLLTALVSFLVLAGSEVAFSRLTDTKARTWSLIDARVSLMAMQREITRAESAQRGYLLTGEQRYLEPYSSASDRAMFEYGNAISLLNGEPDLSGRCVAVGQLLKDKQEELNLTVHLAQSGQRDQAMAVIDAGKGVATMEDLMVLTREIDEAILDRTRAVDQEYRALAERQRWGVGGLVGLNLLFLAALAARTIKHFYEREQQREALARQAEALETAVDARTRELHELSTYLQEQSEWERQRLARDLHDEFGALLTAAKLDVAWLQGRNPGDDPQRTERLTRLGSELDEAVDLKRRVIEILRPAVLEQLGLPDALAWYVQEVAGRRGLAVQLDLQPLRVAPQVALTLYRIAQDALTNTLQHAQATEVAVSLRHEGPEVVMVVADNGQGMPKNAYEPGRGRLGLRGMAHRLQAHRGQFDVSSEPGQGTRLTVKVPASETLMPAA
jgi:signal transduction histidine kinase